MFCPVAQQEQALAWWFENWTCARNVVAGTIQKTQQVMTEVLLGKAHNR